MDALMLALWVRECRDRLAGAHVADARLFGPWRLSLRIGEEARLSISLERAYPAVFLDERPPARPTGALPGPITEMLVGSTLTGVGELSGERILRLDTDRGALIVELLARAPALAALDASGRVMSTYANARRRNERLAAGRTYATPDAPSDVTFPGLDPRTREALETVSASWPEVLERASLRLSPSVVRRAGRVTAVPFALPTDEEIEDPGAERAATANSAVRRAFILRMRQEREARAARRFANRFARLDRRVARAMRAAEADLDRAGKWPLWERFGSTLIAHPRALLPRAKEVTLPDVFDPEGAPMVIPIDPRLSPSANAASYLKRARRAQRAIDVIEARRDSLHTDHQWIRSRAGRERHEWTDEDLTHLETLLNRHRIGPDGEQGSDRSGRAGGRRGARDGFHPRRYRSTDGWLILVGRNNAENDHLSLRIARQEDVWFHAHGVSGSHVVLKREGRKDNPSRRTLEEAASLAALHSKARHAGTVPVIYTKAKYVTKPRRSPPGLVSCSREKTIMVRPTDAERLEQADDVAGEDS